MHYVQMMFKKICGDSHGTKVAALFFFSTMCLPNILAYARLPMLLHIIQFICFFPNVLQFSTEYGSEI